MIRLAPVLLALALALGCAGAAPARAHPAGLDEASAREVLRRFAHALEARRLDEACALLSARWRAAYTPGRLALDLDGAGPAAREAIARVLARLAERAPLRREDGRAELPLGGPRAAVLVAEGGAWRVDALE